MSNFRCRVWDDNDVWLWAIEVETEDGNWITVTSSHDIKVKGKEKSMSEAVVAGRWWLSRVESRKHNDG